MQIESDNTIFRRTSGTARGCGFRNGFFLALATLLFANASGEELVPAMPPPPYQPTEVSVGLFVADVIRVAEVEQTFEIELILYANWQDPRLAFDPEQAGTPVKIFQGEFQVHELFTGWFPLFVVLNRIGRGEADGIRIDVLPDGRVRYLEERNMTIHSGMSLRRYPFDQQTLHAALVAFGSDSSEVILTPADPLRNHDVGRVGLRDELTLAEWRLTDVHSESELIQRDFFGEDRMFSLMNIYFTLERIPGHTIWDILFPLVLLVSLMWSVFWLDSRALTDRLNISFIGMLTIVAYQFLIDGALPAIPYFTFTDSVVFISFLVMAGVIVHNLLLASLHKHHHAALADRVDTVALWSFPFVYAGLLGGAYLYYVLRAL